MKKLLKYIGLVLLGVIVVDFVNRIIFDYTYSHVPKDAELRQRYKYQLNDKPVDLLVIGASRAMFNYVPSIMEDSLHLSVYNAGMDGEGVIGQYLSIKKALSNGKLKYVVYDLGDLQMTSKWNQDRISVYFPYYWKNKDVQEVVDNVMGKEKAYIMLSSSLYQYNSQIHDLVRCFVQKKQNDKGYEGLPYTGVPIKPGTWDKNKKYNAFVPDSTCASYLDKIVNLCKQNNVKLFICMSPAVMFVKSSQLYLEKYCKEHNVKYLDFVDCPETNKNLTLFRDDHHLNTKGTPIFTRVLCDSLKQYIH